MAWARVWRPTQWRKYQTSFSSISRPRTSVRTHLGQPHPCRSRLALPPPRVRQQQQEGVPLSTRPRLTRVKSRNTGCRWHTRRLGLKMSNHLLRSWLPESLQFSFRSLETVVGGTFFAVLPHIGVCCILLVFCCYSP